MPLVVVIPYRDRPAHLAELVPALKARLAATPHKLVVVEQRGDGLFNKGRLLNAAFDQHRHEDAYFCFHDVDMIPEGDGCDYSAPTCPTLVAQFCSQFGYRLPYPSFFGGVTLFPRAHFVGVNGFSNEFWGWGCEDDDLMARIRRQRYPVERRAGRYRCLPHERHVDRAAWVRNVTRGRQRYAYAHDGLGNVPYTVLERSQGADYLHLLVDVGRPLLRDDAAGAQLAREAAFRNARRACRA